MGKENKRDRYGPTGIIEEILVGLFCFLKKFFRDTPKNTPLNLLASEGTFLDKGKAASLNFEN
ncbi:hypothetical protein [Levyella massiliensis]|uniref:hypothetical protein n=1 Tax=Levyella massiliensis TaxID=938289 RepID=UPI0003828690|nr:hypothetical protein [Levyella massiliensis]